METVAGMAVIALALAALFLSVRAQMQAGRVIRMRHEMLAIREAIRLYQDVNQAWPTDVAALVSGGFLPSGFSTTNPWGSVYTITSTTNGASLFTDVPSGVPAEAFRPLGETAASAGGGITLTLRVTPRGEQVRSLFQKKRIAGPWP